MQITVCAPDQLPPPFGIVEDRAHARAVITTIFHAPQAVDEPFRHGVVADDTDDATHKF